MEFTGGDSSGFPLDVWTHGYLDFTDVSWKGGSTLRGTCRGIVTADVLELGLSRGAIAAGKLEGVRRDKEHEGLYWFGPLR